MSGFFGGNGGAGVTTLYGGARFTGAVIDSARLISNPVSGGVGLITVTVDASIPLQPIQPLILALGDSGSAIFTYVIDYFISGVNTIDFAFFRSDTGVPINPNGWNIFIIPLTQ